MNEAINMQNSCHWPPIFINFNENIFFKKKKRRNVKKIVQKSKEKKSQGRTTRQDTWSEIYDAIRLRNIAIG